MSASPDPSPNPPPDPDAGLAAEIAARLAGLERLHPRVIDLSLGRIERLLAALGHPERRLPPVIHIAGTNGKGSVLAFLRACLAAAGLRVHTYTSPHLVRFNERIGLAGVEISDADLLALIGRVEAANAGEPITFFEITTAIAYMAFAETPADWLLLETGLGGRLDATNVVGRPALSVITPVSLDHQGYLGETVTAIAAEKAGIIKLGVPVVIAAQTPDALAVLKQTAARLEAPVFVADEDWRAAATADGFHFQGRGLALDLPRPALPGAHQVGNAATAVACLEALMAAGVLSGVGPEEIAAGLRQAVWPGRLQRLADGPVAAAAPGGWDIWVDGGHNPAAALALADWVTAQERPVWLLVSMLANRDPGDFLAPFAGRAAGVIGLPGPAGHDGHTAAAIAAAARGVGLPAGEAASWREGFRQAVALQAAGQRHEDTGKGDMRKGGGQRADKQKEPATILVTGSLYSVGDVLAANGPRAAG